MNMLIQALQYAAMGWLVFPLWLNTKRPMTRNGFKDGTTNTKQITKWWTQTPMANIGIRTGETSGLVVLDVDMKDGKNGIESLLNLLIENGAELPNTLNSTTPSGGMHYYFKYPDAEIRCRIAMREGLDVRAHGGYIVAPPSLIDGIFYCWSNPNESIAEIPEWLLRAATEKAKKPVQTEMFLKEVGSSPSGNPFTGIQEGQRNDHVFKLACQLHRRKVPIDTAKELILKAANSCIPPLPEDEALRTMESAYRYEESLPEEFVEMNRKHALVMLGERCRVMKHIVDPIFGHADVKFWSTNDFRTFYHNQTLQVGAKTYHLADYWLDSPSRCSYDGVVFSPGGNCDGYFNLWQGFAVNPKEGDCGLYLQHIRENIAGNNEEIYSYIIGWMADTVQNAGKLTGTALVFRGKQGRGKGICQSAFKIDPPSACRGRNAGCPAPPAQIPASGFPALGSCLR